MKTTGITLIGLLATLLLFTGSFSELFAAEQYVYETKDAAAAKKRYYVKLEQDKEKCDLAIINTKTLISRSKNKPYLPELYLRLAELFVEKSRLVYFIRRSIQEHEGQGGLQQYEANQLKQQALEVYQRILSQFPDFMDCDKVRFFMAHEYRELGQVEDMLSAYDTIVREHPDSPYAPEAHLLLGDYYFKQKQDVEKSKAHYEAVLRYPASPAGSVARYKLAWCQINLSDFTSALKLFEESVTSAVPGQDLDIDTYRRVDVRFESLIDMAFCYPEVYKKATPEEALDYFRRFSWSRPTYAAVLEKLAYRYYVKKKWPNAAALYRELAVLRQDPEKLIEYAKHIFDSVQAIGNYAHAEKDVGIIIHALENQRYSVHISREERTSSSRIMSCMPEISSPICMPRRAKAILSMTLKLLQRRISSIWISLPQAQPKRKWHPILLRRFFLRVSIWRRASNTKKQPLQLRLTINCARKPYTVQ